MTLRLFRVVACVLTATFSGAFIGSSADLSTYHQFRIGSDVAKVVRATGVAESEVKVLHQRPALIQELEWSPVRSESSIDFAAVGTITFTFLDRELFRMFVNYNKNKTEGLSPDDIITSLSSVYGAPTKPVATISTGSQSDYAFASNEPVLARWQDEEYSVNLIRSSQQPNFGLIITSRKLDRLGQKAIVEGARLDVVAAPQIERDRRAKEAAEERANQEKARLVNKLAFKP